MIVVLKKKTKHLLADLILFYFPTHYTGSKAVDFLMDSKWASGEKGTKILFTDRNSIVRYLNE